MPQLKRSIHLSPNSEYLQVDGQPWFLLADTIWSAFTHVPDHDWTPYLRTRMEQGFNALLISALPILHDLSAAQDLVEPFAGFWDGAPRYGALRPAYLDAIRARLEAAATYGFTPLITDVWCNYAPATWASKAAPNYVIPERVLPEYLASLADAVSPYGPIHLVSGDADFEEPESIAYYKVALREVKRLAPDSLTALHLQPEAVLPSSLADSDLLDFYVYQSGHHQELQHLPYDLASGYLERPRRRPVINIEPPYDGHGYGFKYGRFDARDVRRASWQSILAGANAGLGYGAHGVWQWHERDAAFNHAEFSGVPFDHQTALSFPGASDVAFLKFLTERLNLIGSSPDQNVLIGSPPEVRAATSRAQAQTVIYTPYATELTVNIDGIVRIERWNLETRAIEAVEAQHNSTGLTIPLPTWIGDSLTVIYRSGH